MITSRLFGEVSIPSPRPPAHGVVIPRFCGLPALVSLIALLVSVPQPCAFAEGEQWVPVYNKLVRMIEERCVAAGTGLEPVEYLDLSATLTQLDLQRLRTKMLDLGHFHYVNHYYLEQVKAEVGPPPADPYVIIGEIPPLIVEDSATDAYGNHIIVKYGAPGEERNVFSAAGLPNENAFTRIPAAYSSPLYCNDFGGAGLQTPVLWEHFDEMYRVLLEYKATMHMGGWVECDGASLESPEYEFTDCETAGTKLKDIWDDPEWGPSPGYPYPDVNPAATYAVAVLGAPLSRYTAAAGRTSSRLRIDDLWVGGEHLVDFFVRAHPPAALPEPPAFEGLQQLDATFNSNGDQYIHDDLWALFDSEDEPNSEPTIISEAEVGRLEPGPVFSSSTGCPAAVGYNEEGYDATDGMGIAMWDFSDWWELDPDGVPNEFGPPPADDESDLLVDECGSCESIECGVDVSPSEWMGAHARVIIPLGTSLGWHGPRLKAAVVQGWTTVPNTGLAMGNPEAGVLQSLNLQSWVESDSLVLADLPEPYEQRFVNVLRPSGRVVTFRMDHEAGTDTSVGVPVGPDAGNFGAYRLIRKTTAQNPAEVECYEIHYRNGDEPDGGPWDQVIHRYNHDFETGRWVLTQVATGSDFETGDATAEGSGGFSAGESPAFELSWARPAQGYGMGELDLK